MIGRIPYILIVDDEAAFALNLARLLQRRGFEAATAFSGREAVERMEADGHRFQAVVLDVRMPDMDGLETLRRIKDMSSAVEVIMLTGQASVEDGIEAVRAGAFDYLQKPCDIEELAARLRDACRVEKIRQHPVLWPRTRAGEVILSGFVPLLPSDTLARALGLFNRYRGGQGAGMLFVVDGSGAIRGSVTKRDLLDAVESSLPEAGATWEWLSEHPEALPDTPLEQVMDRRVETVPPEEPLAETARRMIALHFDSMPVVADGVVRGIIRLRDVLRYTELEEADAAG